MIPLSRRSNSSNLHFQVEENPFAIQIKIRKKFIDNKVSKHDLQTNDSKTLREKLIMLEETLESKSNECETSKEETNHFKSEVTKLSEELFETKLELPNQEISSERVKQETDLEEELRQAKDGLRNEQIRVNDVVLANKKLYKEILNIKEIKGSTSALSTNPTNIANSKFILSKPSSSQPTSSVQTGQETKNSLGSVSISASTFNPKYHPWNNTPLVTSEHSSLKCNHSPQCTIRQPRPPPLPSVTILVNHQSKYHEHILSKAGVPGCYGGHS